MSTTHSLSATAQSPYRTTNQAAMDRARLSLAGGGNSTMRVLPYHLPLVAERGDGCRLWDVEGNEYIDLNMSYGPLLLGHCPPSVVNAVVEQVSQRGSHLGFPVEVSIRVAEKLKQLFPTMDVMRFSSTGTEAIAHALRTARVVTGRKKLIAFEGHYHGWSDGIFNRYHAMLDELPEGDYQAAIPGTIGMNGAPLDVYVCRWNDIDAFTRCMEQLGDDVAGVIMEPIMGNGGVVVSDDQYLPAVREICHDYGSLLIFDEVITGMRVAPGGAQEHYGVYPDITIASKAMGGGYPISAFGASREIMDYITHGKLFHGGVYSGNALVMSAAEATLDYVLENQDEVYKHLFAVGDQLASGIDDIMNRLNVPHQVTNVGPLLSMFVTKEDVQPFTNYRDVRGNCDFESYIEFQHHLQRNGVYFHPNQFEPLFLSTAHTFADIEIVLERIEDGARTCLAK